MCWDHQRFFLDHAVGHEQGTQGTSREPLGGGMDQQAVRPVGATTQTSAPRRHVTRGRSSPSGEPSTLSSLMC